MNSKVMFVVGVGALVASVVFFLISISTSQTGPAGAPDTESIEGKLNALQKEHEKLKARLAGLQEQPASRGTEAAPAADETPPNGKKVLDATASVLRVGQICRKFESKLEKYVKFMAKMIKAQQEGKILQMMNNPEMLEMQADIMKAQAELYKEAGISQLDPVAGPLFTSLVLGPLCRQLGVELSPEQSQKLQAMNYRLVEHLLRIKESEAALEVEKAYERIVALWEFGKGFEEFLTQEQKNKLGMDGKQYDMAYSLTVSGLDHRPKEVEEQVRTWQRSFGFSGDRHTGQLTSIAQDYSASYRELEAGYSDTQKLTQRQREEKTREQLKIEVEALTRISQLGLTEEQRKKVVEYNPFSPWEEFHGYMGGGGMAAHESRAIAKLRTLSSAQELYNTRHDCYATVLEELQKVEYINKSFQDEEYTYEVTSTAPDKWYATATPSDWSKKHFYIDQTGAIRCEEGRPADSSSPLVGG